MKRRVRRQTNAVARRPSGAGYAASKNDRTTAGGGRWQVRLAGKWEDLDTSVQEKLNSSARVKQKSCDFSFGEQAYRCDFTKMFQLNLKTGRQRDLRCLLPGASD